MPRRNHPRKRRRPAPPAPKPEPTPDHLAGSLVQRGLAPGTILGAGIARDTVMKGSK